MTFNIFWPNKRRNLESLCFGLKKGKRKKRKLDERREEKDEERRKN